MPGGSGLPTGTTRQLTQTPESEYNARWTESGKIVFLKVVDGEAQMFEMAAEGGETRQLTAIPEGINDFELGKDDAVIFGKTVKMDATVNELYEDLPDAEARIIDDLMYRHWNQWDDYSYNHVFVMDYPKDGMVKDGYRDLMKGERVDSPVPPFGGSEQYTYTADGTGIVYAAKKTKDKVEWAKSTNTDLYHVNLADGKTTNLTSGMMGYDMEATYSPDGKYMAWLSMERDGYESDRNRIFIKEVKSGKQYEITQGFPHPASHIAWSADGKSVYFTAPIKGTIQIFKTEISSQVPRKVTQVTTGQHK